ncbi:hypothetical protein M0657_011370 [Pyricularia oryzae]|nr:hypothetical protein M0657_011370 [Pyricularia oryzae]
MHASIRLSNPERLDALCQRQEQMAQKDADVLNEAQVAWCGRSILKFSRIALGTSREQDSCYFAELMTDNLAASPGAKTLTAEGVADKLRKPLMLEYHKGILIMTTNRADTIDLASKSRIHQALHYPELSLSLKSNLWKQFSVPTGWSSNFTRTSAQDRTTSASASIKALSSPPPGMPSSFRLSSNQVSQMGFSADENAKHQSTFGICKRKSVLDRLLSLQLVQEVAMAG